MIVCSTTCAVRIIDFDTGTLCSSAVLPGDYQSEEFNVQIQAFASGGSLKKPIFNLVRDSYDGYGIDAATGTVLYTFNMGNNTSMEFENFVARSSPTNELFGYCMMLDGMEVVNKTYFIIRNIADGSLMLQAQWTGDVASMLEGLELSGPQDSFNVFGIPVTPVVNGPAQFLATLPPVPTEDEMDGILASFQYVDEGLLVWLPSCTVPPSTRPTQNRTSRVPSVSTEGNPSFLNVFHCRNQAKSQSKVKS